MKAGSFNLNDYLQRLHEEKEATSKVPDEGIIIPEENPLKLSDSFQLKVTTNPPSRNPLIVSRRRKLRNY